MHRLTDVCARLIAPPQATPKPAAADAPTTSSQTASAIVSSDIANGSKGAPVESTSSAPKKRAAKRKADAEMPVEDKNAMEVDDGAAATAASSTDDSLKKQKISDASRASAAATTVGHEQVDVTMMDESVDGECLALVAEQLCLNKPFEWTLTHHVEAYDGKETNAVHNNLRQHLAALLKTNTPLQAAQQQLILDMIGVSDSSYQVLPSALQQQTLQHVHTIRAPSAGKALVHRMPSTKWPPHPLVLEFGTGDKANAHIIQHGKMTIGGAWMCLVSRDAIQSAALSDRE